VGTGRVEKEKVIIVSEGEVRGWGSEGGRGGGRVGAGGQRGGSSRGGV